MTTLQTAAQQALNRLRLYYYGSGFAEDADCITALEAALAQQADKPQRPKCFEFALDFLGTPENGELLAYIEQLEARAALAQQQAGSWQDGVLEGHLRERERWLAQEQAEPKKGGNLPPPLQTHCPNCAGPETQNTELDRKAAFAKRGEALYHPCTYILILGLKKLNAYDVLAEWDKARAEVDALAPRQTEKVK